MAGEMSAPELPDIYEEFQAAALARCVFGLEPLVWPAKNAATNRCSP
jgi:hypothetical protein